MTAIVSGARGVLTVATFAFLVFRAVLVLAAL